MIALEFGFDDADPVITCECGWRAHGDSADDAWRAWYRHMGEKHKEDA